jgi:hypothetical protein
MKGSNQFELNEATMCEIVQYWLDEVFLRESNKVTVTSVEKSSGSYDAGFTIKVKTEDAE